MLIRVHGSSGQVEWWETTDFRNRNAEVCLARRTLHNSASNTYFIKASGRRHGRQGSTSAKTPSYLGERATPDELFQAFPNRLI